MSNTTESSNKDNTKLTLILIYVFWIVGLILHFQNKTKIGAFHLRQTLGLWIAAVVAFIVTTILVIILAMISGSIASLVGMILQLVICVGCLVCWVIGLLGALKSEEKLMPVVGPFSQKLLGKLFE